MPAPRQREQRANDRRQEITASVAKLIWIISGVGPNNQPRLPSIDRHDPHVAGAVRHPSGPTRHGLGTLHRDVIALAGRSDPSRRPVALARHDRSCQRRYGQPKSTLMASAGSGTPGR